LVCRCVDQSKFKITTGTDGYVTRVIYYPDRFEPCYMCFPCMPSTLTVLRDAIYFKYKSLRYADPEPCISMNEVEKRMNNDIREGPIPPGSQHTCGHRRVVTS
jgi:hypothetical protein